MFRRILILLAIATVLGLGIFWLLTQPLSVAAGDLPSHTADLANGKTMFSAGGCASCHAVPGNQDRTVLGGGLALRSPFGTFYVPNISPNPADGIGRWSEAQFVTAMLKGTSPDGSHYYPAFPYTSYQRMTLNDVRDLFAYLTTLPQAAGKVRDHDLPFPFNIRRTLGIWKVLFLDGKLFVPDVQKSQQWNRGAYLVNGPGHCAECHSPRNAFGGIVAAQRFAGGPDAEGEGFVPNITQKALGDWSQKDFEALLETGETPGGESVGGAMAPVIRNTSQLAAADRAAMAVYLKSLPAMEGPKPAKKK